VDTFFDVFHGGQVKRKGGGPPRNVVAMHTFSYFYIQQSSLVF